jgi:hypothetical protein
MRATIVLILLLIITGTVACGGANNRRYTVAVTPVAVLPPQTAASGDTAPPTVVFNTRSDYVVTIDDAKYRHPEIIQILRRLDGRSSDGPVFERIKSSESSASTFRLALSPGMPWIAFQVTVDNGAGGRMYLSSERDWQGIRVFDGTVNFTREVGVTRSGSFRGEDHGLFKIMETTIK